MSLLFYQHIIIYFITSNDKTASAFNRIIIGHIEDVIYILGN